eukprot:2782356-Pleurochrysis_carterae.AAC.1
MAVATAPSAALYYNFGRYVNSSNLGVFGRVSGLKWISRMGGRACGPWSTTSVELITSASKRATPPLELIVTRDIPDRYPSKKNAVDHSINDDGI